MRPSILLPAVACIFSSILNAQRSNTGFAITSDLSNSQHGAWMNISEVDINSGQVIRPLLEKARTSFALYDGISKSKLLSEQLDVSSLNPGNSSRAMPLMIAAAAYDQRHHRLFFAPLFYSELRWIDLDDKSTTLKVYRVPFSFISDADLLNEGNNITRMTMGSDGYGYALTNDGNHLIRFTSGRKLIITDLGALQDASANGAISVHNRCSSFGGDMIGDAGGNLYLISAYHAIFKIDLPSKEATYIGTIKNLPANYTTNGAAVDDKGDLIVSSVNSTEGYFKVNMATWEAVKVAGSEKIAGASDLASCYFAFDSHKNLRPADTFITKPVEVLKKISVYPNPVTEGIFRISFDNKEKGRYLVQLVELTGKVVFQQGIAVEDKYQLVELSVPGNLAKGIYMIKIVNSHSNGSYSDKILIN